MIFRSLGAKITEGTEFGAVFVWVGKSQFGCIRDYMPFIQINV